MRPFKISRTLGLVLAGLLLFRLADAQYAIKQSVFGNGGQPVTGGSNRINGTLGQTVIGRVSGASNKNDIGFWYGEEIAVNLQGIHKIAFVGGGIHVMNPDGTGRTGLTNGTDLSPSWSPDGTRIVFDSLIDYETHYQIYAINSDGTGLTRLTNNTASDFEPSWSPDGTKIAFSRSNQVYVMNADGSGQNSLGVSGADPSWSPDGTKIAFSSSTVFVMNADGSGQTTLTVGQSPSWSPDGTKIAFWKSTGGGNYEVFVINLDGSNLTQLTNGGGNMYPCWSPDGRRIAFTSERDGGNWQIYVMNADGSNQTRLTTYSAYEPSWGESFRRIGSTNLNTSILRVLAIENRSATTLTVSNITSSDPQFTVSPTSFSVAAGGKQDVMVRFIPTSAGVKYSTLTITSNDPITPTAKLIVNGTGIGATKPVASASKKGMGGLAKAGEDSVAVPEAFGLDQSYPNPFNPATTIRYALPEAVDVQLVIYNVLGQKVKTLVNEVQKAGYYRVVWDGKDDAGRPVATGVYIYRIQAGSFVEVRKMLTLK